MKLIIAIITLIIIIEILDFITGVIKSIVQKTYTSHECRIGALKKTTYMMSMIGLVVILAIATYISTTYHYDITPITSILSISVFMKMVVGEISSIIENLKYDK